MYKMDTIAGPAGLIDIVVDKKVTDVSVDDISNAHHVLSDMLGDLEIVDKTVVIV